jgi:hypothetical protein
MPRRRPALSPTSPAAVALDCAFRLCAAYLQGGFSKATDFGGAIAELNPGLTRAVPFAIVSRRMIARNTGNYWLIWQISQAASASVEC